MPKSWGEFLQSRNSNQSAYLNCIKSHRSLNLSASTRSLIFCIFHYFSNRNIDISSYLFIKAVQSYFHHFFKFKSGLLLFPRRAAFSGKINTGLCSSLKGTLQKKRGAKKPCVKLKFSRIFSYVRWKNVSVFIRLILRYSLILLLIRLICRRLYLVDQTVFKLLN